MYKLVLIRHGESTWNQENRFTGWTDVDLSDRGRQEAAEAGRLLKEGGYSFDQAYVSVLKRAIRTLAIVMDALDQWWLPVEKSWRLNERHYGALQGLNKAETAARFGDEQPPVQVEGFLGAGEVQVPPEDIDQPAAGGGVDLDIPAREPIRPVELG